MNLNKIADQIEMEEDRYFFDSDDDGHNYLLPVELRDEWDVLRNEPNSWELPGWQKFEDRRIDGISEYTFTNPKTD